MDDEWEESTPTTVQPVPAYTTTFTRGGGGRGRNSDGGERRDFGDRRGRGGGRGFGDRRNDGDRNYQSDGSNWRTGERQERGPRDGGGGNRRGADHGGGRCTRTISVPSNKVGRVIGKGGSKIRELEYDSSASIKIGDSSGVETEVTLSGEDEDVLQRAEELINALMEDFKPREPRRKETYGGDNDGRRGADFGGGSCTRAISVPSNKVGRIIGKGGSKIRELEYESSASIKIGNSGGDETEVTLSGEDEDALERAENLINQLMEDFKRAM